MSGTDQTKDKAGTNANNGGLMKNKNLIYIIIATLVIIIVILLTRTTYQMPWNMMGDNQVLITPSSSQVNTSSADYRMYANLSGDSYDQAFLANMIDHHQGAVDMAKLALTNAKHTELKDLAERIISSQTAEIKDMTEWQKSFGYAASSGEMMMDHSSMGMQNDMANMNDQLKSLSGDVFDKKFLELMIEHHQSAIDMSDPGSKNAKHTEVKSLTEAIVKAQSQEIGQMKQWQKDWGYTR